MRYRTNIDIMYGERYHATIRNYMFDSLFGITQGIADMLNHIYNVKPYLRRRERFEVWWKNEQGQDMNITVMPQKNQL